MHQAKKLSLRMSASGSELSDTDVSDQYSMSDEEEFSAEETLPPGTTGVKGNLLASGRTVAKKLKAKKKKEEEELKRVPGVVYLSRIPPYMKPHKLKQLLSPYGRVQNVFLQPEEDSVRKRRVKYGGSKKRNFTEGWVEFADKRVAKAVAMALNNFPIGGRKRNYYHDDIWNIKYLPKFRWSHIGEKRAYERAVMEQELRTEMSQARRENSHYMKNLGKSKAIKAIVKRKRKRRQKRGGEEEDEEEEDKAAKKHVRSYSQRIVITTTAPGTAASEDSAPSSNPTATTRPAQLQDALLKKILPG